MTPQQVLEARDLRVIAERLVYKTNLDKGGRVYLCKTAEGYDVFYNDIGTCVKLHYTREYDYRNFNSDVESLVDEAFNAFVSIGLRTAGIFVRRAIYDYNGRTGVAYAIYVETLLKGVDSEEKAMEYLGKLRAVLPEVLRDRAYVFNTRDGWFMRVKIPVVDDAFTSFVGSLTSELGVGDVGGDEEGGSTAPVIDVDSPRLTLRLSWQAPPAGAPEVPEKPVERENEEGREDRRAELVPVFILGMNLPSKYLVQDVEYRINEDGDSIEEAEVRKWVGPKAKLASALETLRHDVYRRLRRNFCFIPEYGVWVAVTENGVKEAMEAGGYVTRKLRELGINDEETLKRYFVRPIRVYLEPEDARRLLETAVRRLEDDLRALEERVRSAEEEGRKRALERLARDREYREALLEAFREYLDKIDSLVVRKTAP
jgi:hypothetical protein